mmetsp:Transcript_14807/g.48513  ORF Transcript_14807/g.48513 Transcript_14807/m.48513 type:complete len:300 (-) Transcript_14807:168-1067(-)
MAALWRHGELREQDGIHLGAGARAGFTNDARPAQPERQLCSRAQRHHGDQRERISGNLLSQLGKGETPSALQLRLPPAEPVGQEHSWCLGPRRPGKPRCNAETSKRGWPPNVSVVALLVSACSRRQHRRWLGGEERDPGVSGWHGEYAWFARGTLSNLIAAAAAGRVDANRRDARRAARIANRRAVKGASERRRRAACAERSAHRRPAQHPLAVHARLAKGERRRRDRSQWRGRTRKAKDAGLHRVLLRYCHARRDRRDGMRAPLPGMGGDQPSRAPNHLRAHRKHRHSSHQRLHRRRV